MVVETVALGGVALVGLPGAHGTDFFVLNWKRDPLKERIICANPETSAFSSKLAANKIYCNKKERG
jgi:hypothetical protein